MPYTEQYSGICPKTGTAMCIQLTVGTVPLAFHQTTPSKKVLDYSCPYGREHECDIYMTDRNNCPLYLHARRAAR